MRTAVKAITSFISLLAAMGAHAQTRVIDQNWQFSPDPKAQFTATTVGRAAKWRPAKASLSWNAQYDDLRDYASVGWYRVNVALPAPQPSTRELIHFGAVDYLTRVWVNGNLLGKHEGGYTPFTFDLTGKCTPAITRSWSGCSIPRCRLLSLHPSRTLRRRRKS